MNASTNAVEVIERATVRPLSTARMTGLLYLLAMVAGIIAEGLISGRLRVSGDAAATTTNILAHRPLFETGFALYLIEMVCQVAMTALFYELLKPAGRTISLVAAFIGLAGCVIKTLARLFFIAPLFVLDGSSYLNAFSTHQLQALALLLLDVNDHGAGIALAFFGFYTILVGYLTIKATFLPRFLGVLSVVAGLGWLTFLYPPLGFQLFFYIAPIGLVGAFAWIFWLLVFGVDEQRWREQANAAVA